MKTQEHKKECLRVGDPIWVNHGGIEKAIIVEIQGDRVLYKLSDFMTIYGILDDNRIWLRRTENAPVPTYSAERVCQWIVTGVIIFILAFMGFLVFRAV